jgi:hypothetical protein
VIDGIAAESGIRINIGCGLSPTPGWANFDNSLSVRIAHWPVIPSVLARFGFLGPQSAKLTEMAQCGSVRFARATARIPCVAGSAAVVYSSHMIEHLDRAEARAFLTEVKRVLRPGGVVRIAAPDLGRLVSDYVATGDADWFVAGSHLGLDRPAGLKGWVKWAVVGPRHHLWMYDGESLTRLLRETGFTDAAVVPAGTTTITNPGLLDLRERASESVYAEAVRPG